MATVNLSQASEITGINPQTLRNHIKKGYLEAEQVDFAYNYKIDLDCLRGYALYMHQNSRVSMFNPILDFDNRAKIVLNKALR